MAASIMGVQGTGVLTGVIPMGRLISAQFVPTAPTLPASIAGRKDKLSGGSLHGLQAGMESSLPQTATPTETLPPGVTPSYKLQQPNPTLTFTPTATCEITPTSPPVTGDYLLFDDLAG